MARGVDLAIEAITAGTRLIDEVQLTMPAAELLQEIGDRVRRVGDLAVKTDFACSSGPRDGDSNGFLVDIEPDIGVKIHDGPSPVHEDRRSTRNPRQFAHCGDGPPRPPPNGHIV